jgi:uncharacterized RDD family membrane protein YckC
MACWVYEGLLVFGVCFIAGYLFSTLSQTRHALNNRHALQAFLFVVFGIYFVWFWAKGQTLAMKTWHIRVVDAAGHAISQRRASLRYLLAWVWLLPPLAASSLLDLSGARAAMLALIWVAFWALASYVNPERQFWHDVWAGTRLIESRAADKPPHKNQA